MAAKEPLLKSREVAHILDCSPDDVIELVRKGTLRAVKTGRFWRFRQDDVVAYKQGSTSVGGCGTMAKKESLLKSREVAHILDCSPDDVIELARRGKLRAVKTGRFWRFRQDDVVAYKKRNESGK
jgi:excisionase family DNA binding protein